MFGLKPTIRISHVTIQEGQEGTVVASKMLYASHYFWTGLELRALLPDLTEGSRFLVGHDQPQPFGRPQRIHRHLRARPRQERGTGGNPGGPAGYEGAARSSPADSDRRAGQTNRSMGWRRG